jgi:hypothetical protein
MASLVEKMLAEKPPTENEINILKGAVEILGDKVDMSLEKQFMEESTFIELRKELGEKGMLFDFDAIVSYTANNFIEMSKYGTEFMLGNDRVREIGVMDGHVSKHSIEEEPDYEHIALWNGISTTFDQTTFNTDRVFTIEERLDAGFNALLAENMISEIDLDDEEETEEYEEEFDIE